MALKGESRVAVTGQCDLVFAWVAVQSAGNNTSTVSWNLSLVSGSYGKLTAGTGRAWAVTVGTEVFSGTADVRVDSSSRCVLASGTAGIAHDQLGNGSFHYAFSQDFNIQVGSVYIGTVSGAGDALLDAIQRPVSPETVSQAALGSAVFIDLVGPGNTACDVLWVFGEHSGTIASGATGRVQWIPPLELAALFPNWESALFTLRCVSANGSGDTGIRLTVPESVVPEADVRWTDRSGAFAGLGMLVQNVSALDVEVDARGAYGSAVTDVRVALDGKAYRGGVLTEDGEHSLTVTLTDSRGRSAAVTQSLTVAYYRPPWVQMEASRCQRDGTHDDTGEFAHVKMVGTVTELDGSNSASLKLVYGGMEQSFFVTADRVAGECIIPASSVEAVELRCVLSDSLMSAAHTMVLSTGYATADLLAGGKGIAFGTTATREGFECAMPAFFTGGVHGAAPDGFGIGSDGNTRITVLDDYNEGVKTGFYRGSGVNVRNSPTVEMDSGVLAVEAGVGYIHQLLRRDGFTAERWYTPASGWVQWQWINPPMQPGLSYRTNRFFLGMPVYTMLLDFGNLPNQGVTTVPLGNMGFVCGIRGIVYRSGRYSPVCMGYDGNLGAYFYAGNASLSCRTMADLSAYKAYVVLEYTDEL